MKKVRVYSTRYRVVDNKVKQYIKEGCVISYNSKKLLENFSLNSKNIYPRGLILLHHGLNINESINKILTTNTEDVLVYILEKYPDLKDPFFPDIHYDEQTIADAIVVSVPLNYPNFQIL